MKESMSLRFLYGTVPGRVVLKLLVHPWVSKIAGCFLSSPVSKGIIPSFIRRNHIDMEDIIVPKGGFASFNEFFYRKRRGNPMALEEGQLISPCDGYLRAVTIKNNVVFDVKYSRYTLEDLLQNGELARKFEDGTALIFRLTPANYHRYCYPVNGSVMYMKKIPGKLHCVRPIALRTTPVFIQNSREYQIIKSDRFGLVTQMEVGALLVGKIRNHEVKKVGPCVKTGMEKGYFEFGGSTIILLFQKDSLELDMNMFKNVDGEGETPVRMGDVVGWAKG